jgi:hypothetical protein
MMHTSLTTSLIHLLRPASAVVVAVGVSLLATACGGESAEHASTLPAPVATQDPMTAISVGEPAGESTADESSGDEPEGGISVTALRLGRLSYDSPTVDGVPYRVEPVDGTADPILGATTSPGGVRHAVAPGEYRIVVDHSGLGHGPCEGAYEMIVSVSADEDTMVTAYSVEDGVEQFGVPSCLSVAVLPSLDSASTPCPEAPTLLSPESP